MEFDYSCINKFNGLTYLFLTHIQYGLHAHKVLEGCLLGLKGK